MEELYFLDKTFEGLQHRLEKGEYENCIFRNCDFQNMNLSHYQFIDCAFSTCNLSLVKTDNLVLRDVEFNGSKLLGFRFDLCSAFGLSLSFENCQLDQSSFYGVKIKKTKFNTCSLKSVDFTDADLTSVTFHQCNLENASFEHTNLEYADFRTALQYSINPEQNQFKKTRFSNTGLAGLLDKYDLQID